jgi:hypothetical protein
MPETPPPDEIPMYFLIYILFTFSIPQEGRGKCNENAMKMHPLLEG